VAAAGHDAAAGRARAQAAQLFGEMHQLPALMVQIGANSAPIAGIPTD